MPEETPTEITKAEQAKWSGIVSGFIGGAFGGIIANWKEIAIVTALVHGLWTDYKETRDAKWIGQHLSEKQNEIDSLKTNLNQNPK